MTSFTNSYPNLILTGATVIITGAGRGIGLATAELFADAGARVVLADIDGGLAEQAADRIGRGALGRTLDVRSKDSWAAIAAEFTDVKVLVNNAGVMPLGAFLDESDDISAATMDINVWGLIHGMRTIVPSMVARGRGHVVNVASMAGKLPIAGMAVYNASKFGAVGLSAAARLEFAEHGVSVSAILPSAVRTGLASGVQLGHGMPTVDPEDVAQAILRTCVHRRAETPVPGYLSSLDLGLAVAPERLMNGIRRVIGGRRALDGVDPAGRADYVNRVASVAKKAPTD